MQNASGVIKGRAKSVEGVQSWLCAVLLHTPPTGKVYLLPAGVHGSVLSPPFPVISGGSCSHLRYMQSSSPYSAKCSCSPSRTQRPVIRFSRRQSRHNSQFCIVSCHRRERKLVTCSSWAERSKAAYLLSVFVSGSLIFTSSQAHANNLTLRPLSFEAPGPGRSSGTECVHGS